MSRCREVTPIIADTLQWSVTVRVSVEMTIVFLEKFQEKENKWQKKGKVVFIGIREIYGFGNPYN